jgi:hypothetical protein
MTMRTFVVVAKQAQGGDVAIPAERVAAAAPAGTATRALRLVLSDGGERVVEVSGALAVRAADVSSVCALPRGVAERARWIEGIVFGADGERPLFVVDVDRWMCS